MNSSPGGVNLAKSIVEKLVKKKTSGRPWQGPLPLPRVSPLRMLGDAIATASYRKGSSGRRSASLDRLALPAKSFSTEKKASSKFEFLISKCPEPVFSSEPFTAAPIGVIAITTGMDAGPVQRVPLKPARVDIGPGKFFRPTSGLVSLFARTGTRVSSYNPKSSPSKLLGYEDATLDGK